MPMILHSMSICVRCTTTTLHLLILSQLSRIAVSTVSLQLCRSMTLLRELEAAKSESEKLGSPEQAGFEMVQHWCLQLILTMGFCFLSKETVNDLGSD